MVSISNNSDYVSFVVNCTLTDTLKYIFSKPLRATMGIVEDDHLPTFCINPTRFVTITTIVIQIPVLGST